MPLATTNEPDKLLPAFVNEFYDPAIQDVLYSRPNILTDIHAGKLYTLYTQLCGQPSSAQEGAEEEAEERNKSMALQVFVDWILSMRCTTAATGHIEASVIAEDIVYCLFGLSYPPPEPINNNNEDTNAEAPVASEEPANSPKPPSTANSNNATKKASTFPPMPTTLTNDFLEQLLYKAINYVDFLHYLTRVIGSNFWIVETTTVNESGAENALLPLSGASVMTDATNSTANNTTAVNAQVLKKKLIAFLVELPTPSLSFSVQP